MSSRASAARVPRQDDRTYVRVRFRVPAAMIDDAAGILIAKGALGCSSNVRPSGLDAFFRRLPPGRLARLQETLRSAGFVKNLRAPVTVERIVDPGWATAWQKRFAALKVARHLVIVPPWDRSQHPDRLRIVIKPARAFGTGHHPTTRSALRAIEQLCESRRFTNALDAGTGSGVLAFAMSRLGIRRIAAIDVDPVALENARENTRLNHLAGRIRFSSRPLDYLRGRFDLIVANILRDTLIALAPAIKRLLTNDGIVVVGGILVREARTVVNSYRPELRCIERRVDGGWATLVLAR